MQQVVNGKEVHLNRLTKKDSLLIEHLLELYVYDFTEYMDLDVDEEGLFHYPFEVYFKMPAHYIYLIRVNNNIAGLVLMKQTADENNNLCYTISEFFILKKYRRMGIGAAVGKMIFFQYPGQWLIYESKKNLPAQAFWRKVIHECAHGNYQEYYKDGKPHQLFEISHL